MAWYCLVAWKIFIRKLLQAIQNVQCLTGRQLVDVEAFQFVNEGCSGLLPGTVVCVREGGRIGVIACDEEIGLTAEGSFAAQSVLLKATQLRARNVEHIFRHASQLGYLNTVALARSAGLHLIQKDDVAPVLLGAQVDIANVGQRDGRLVSSK